MIKGNMNYIDNFRVQQCMAATYNVMYTNGVVVNYAIDVIDFIEDYPKQFKPSLYNLLDKLEEKIREYSDIVKVRTHDNRWYCFTFDSGNIAYKKLYNDIRIMEMTHNQVMTKNRIAYSKLKSKMLCLKIMTDIAYISVNKWINEFPTIIKTSENTVIDPRMTFSPLKLKGFSDIVYRLYGMFSENKIDFDKDLNVENSKQVVMNKLTDADFIQSIIKEAHDLANGISPDKRKEIDNKETIDKLKEHFNSK